MIPSNGDPMPNDHDTVGMLAHDVADEVCNVCGFAASACLGGAS